MFVSPFLCVPRWGGRYGEKKVSFSREKESAQESTPSINLAFNKLSAANPYTTTNPRTLLFVQFQPQASPPPSFLSALPIAQSSTLSMPTKQDPTRLPTHLSRTQPPHPAVWPIPHSPAHQNGRVTTQRSVSRYPR